MNQAIMSGLHGRKNHEVRWATKRAPAGFRLAAYRFVGN